VSSLRTNAWFFLCRGDKEGCWACKRQGEWKNWFVLSFLGGSLVGNHVGGAWCPASLKKITVCHCSESKHKKNYFVCVVKNEWSWDRWWVCSPQRHNTEKSLPSFPSVLVGKIPRKYHPILNRITESRCNSTIIVLGTVVCKVGEFPNIIWAGRVKPLAARGQEKHVWILLIFARITSFMLFTVLLSLMYFFLKTFWFTVNVDSWF
jgi:hypothetical protein